MRKIFRIASFALLLAVGVACSTDDVPQEPLGTYPILFRCMDETRAVATVGSMQSDTNGFDVYAFFTNNAINASQSFNKTVKYDDASGKWLYSGLEYWIPGATYYFKAVYPTTIDYAVDNSSTTQSLTITGYDITKQYDILVAETSRDGLLVNANGEPTSGSIVNLNFQHLLANVSVMVKSEINDVIVKSVSFENIANKGNLNENDWSSNEETTLTKSMEVPLVKDADFVDVTDGGFLVIPQQIDGKSQYINIETTHKIYNDIIIPKITWENGMKYTYTLTIKQDNIVFNDPSVEEWDEENATGSVIIK